MKIRITLLSALIAFSTLTAGCSPIQHDKGLIEVAPIRGTTPTKVAKKKSNWFTAMFEPGGMFGSDPRTRQIENSLGIN